jgi:signal transduction histidine kinase
VTSVSAEKPIVVDVTHAGDSEDEVLAALAAMARVARALVGSGSLTQLAERALDEIRDALALEVVALYLPSADEGPALRRFVTSQGANPVLRARDEVSFDAEAWRLAVASGAPLLFREEAGWLVANPFEPAAESWLLVPLVSEAQLEGVVVAAARRPLSLDRASATGLTLLGDLLSAGVATARLRQELQATEIERERMRLAADIHDGLAQDLALAVRELAVLDTDPAPELARASADRLREAVTAAHRIVRSRLEDLSVSVPLGGIQAAIEDVCSRRGQGLPLVFRCSGPVLDLSPETTAVVLRVLAEALANVQRHAAPSNVEVRLDIEGERLTLAIADDGAGFSVGDVGGPGDGHFGLTLMRERAGGARGQLSVRSSGGRGTIVTLQVPVR